MELVIPTWSSPLGNTSLTPHQRQLPKSCPTPLTSRDMAKSCMSIPGTQEISTILHHHHPHQSPYSHSRGHVYCRRPRVCITSTIFPRDGSVLPWKPWVGLCHAPHQLHRFVPVSGMCLPQLFAEDFCLCGSCLSSGWDDGCYCFFSWGPCPRQSTPIGVPQGVLRLWWLLLWFSCLPSPQLH